LKLQRLTKLKGLRFSLTFSLIAYSTFVGPLTVSNAADPTFPNNFKVSLKWHSTTFSVLVEPGKNFIAGKTPAKKYIEKYAQTACGSWYQFWQLGITGASGKGMSTWAPKNAKTYFKVVRSSWGADEYGEDEFTIDAYCYGSLGTTLTGKSNYYQLSVYAPDYYRYYNPKPNQVTWVVESPNYTFQDLLNVKGNVEMEIEMTDNPQKAYDWYFYKGGCINMDCQPTKWFPESTYVSVDG
jgi:hypothetical protein